jgi:hypothetical protein
LQRQSYNILIIDNFVFHDYFAKIDFYFESRNTKQENIHAKVFPHIKKTGVPYGTPDENFSVFF